MYEKHPGKLSLENSGESVYVAVLWSLDALMLFGSMSQWS